MPRFSSKKADITENKEGSPHVSNIHCALEKLKKMSCSISTLRSKHLAANTKKGWTDEKNLSTSLFTNSCDSANIFVPKFLIN
jgi:hypothetical protein